MATAIQLPTAPPATSNPPQAHAEQEDAQTGEVNISNHNFCRPCLEHCKLKHFSFCLPQFYIVRVDASTNVEVPGGCFVTVESGPHTGLPQALHNLAHPKARVSYYTPFLPR